MKTTWREELTNVLKSNGDSFQDIIHCTLDDAGLDKAFDPGYGGTEGEPFTAWTAGYVYFPLCYDGSEWVGSAPRNPCDIALDHQGGG